MKRSIAVILFLLWTGIILSAYYVVQKPGLLNAFAGLADTLWTLVVAALLLFDAYGIGIRILSRLGTNTIEPIERLLLGVGIGLGGLGLLGLIISVAQIAATPIFFLFLIGFTVFSIFSGDLRLFHSDLLVFTHHWNLSFSQYSFFSKLTLLLLFAFSFLLTLVPPFEAFDALLYHLAQPARILQDGGLRPVDIPPFWFPNVTENVYLWALALGSERATQIIHWTWGILSVLLLWHWVATVWNAETGRKALLLLAAMPSLPLLASWAYADMALVFYAIATLYSINKFETGRLPGWLWISGVTAGLAMSVKYTSFTIPLTAGLLLLLRGRQAFTKSLAQAVQFSAVASLVAALWYVRNAIVMGNPFYPFVFGGRYWDAFRAEWYASPGTGIGWNPVELFMLPLNVILGHRDEIFFDGRIGPLFLILAPLALWVLFTQARRDSEQGLSLQAIGLFSAISFAAWTIGVTNSQSLWQARLLFPAMIPFAIPTALGWDSLRMLDTSKLRISVLANAVIAIVIALTVLDNAMFVLQRNPPAVAFGAQTRQGYIARVNPSYAALMQMMNELPETAYAYHLFEPRSYGLPRRTQPDAINYNFAHDFYLYGAPAEIIQHWKREGYTHVILYERGLNFLAEDTSGKFTAAMQDGLQKTLARLEFVDRTPDKVYTMYRIP